MRTFWLAAIRFYQRRISPYKGFSCAHAAYHHGPTCSTAIAEIVRDYGLPRGWPRIRARLKACRAAYEALLSERETPPPKRGKKREGRACADCGGSACDLADLAPSSCTPKMRGCDGCDIGPCDFS